MVTHPSTLQLRPASPSDLPWIQTWLQHYQLAPATLQQTTEFTSLCPAAAICMGLQLTGPDLPHPPD